MWSLYRKRRDVLIDAPERHTDDMFELEPCRADMQLIGWLQDNLHSEMDVANSICNAAIDCPPGSICCDESRVRPGIMPGFACAPEAGIEVQVIRMKDAIAHANQSSQAAASFLSGSKKGFGTADSLRNASGVPAATVRLAWSTEVSSIANPMFFSSRGE